MVLKEAIILVGNAADATEDRAFHEVVCVRTIPVNDICSVRLAEGDGSCNRLTVIIPDIYLWDLAIGIGEWLCREPFHLNSISFTVCKKSSWL